jgi:hypothetical protein
VPAGRPASLPHTPPDWTSTLRREPGEWSTGPVCILRDIDLGIAVGAAAKTAAIHSADCRCQTRGAVAARKTGLIRADHSVALSPSITPKAIGFDRAMPDADFDNLALPSTGTLPAGIPESSPTAARETARNPATQCVPPGPDRRALIWHAHPGTGPVTTSRPRPSPKGHHESQGGSPCTAGPW